MKDQSEIDEAHELLKRNVKEENEKNTQELENSTFDINSKRNLISVAKETLKPKIHHYINRYHKHNSLSPKKKKYLSNSDKISFNTVFSQNFKNLNISNDRQYLNYMMNELKVISSTIQKRLKRFNPSAYNGESFDKKNISNSSCMKKSTYKIGNLYTLNLGPKRKCNEVNLLNQIIGDSKDNENSENYNDNNEKESYDKNKVGFFFTEIDNENNINLYEENNNNNYFKYNSRNISLLKKNDEKKNDSLYSKKGSTKINKVNKAVNISGEAFFNSETNTNGLFSKKIDKK